MKLNKKLIILLLVTAFLGLFSSACRHNWILHARLNMFLRGYMFCRVEIPPNFAKVPDFRPTSFVTGLVYADGSLVGSLNGQGALVLLNEADISQDERETRVDIILFLLEYMFGILFVGASLVLLWKVAKAKRNRALGSIHL